MFLERPHSCDSDGSIQPGRNAWQDKYRPVRGDLYRLPGRQELSIFGFWESGNKHFCFEMRQALGTLFLLQHNFF